VGDQTYRSELRLARARTAQPISAGDWSISVVDTTRVPCAGLCATGTACVQAAMVNMMPNGDPSISSCLAVDTTPCPTACKTGQVCIQGMCTNALAATITELPEGTGLFAQLRRFRSGLLAIVYHDRTQGDLKLALERPDHSFVISLIDGGDPKTDVGQF